MKSLIPWKRKNEELISASRMDNPFEALQRRMNSLFDDFSEDLWQPMPWLNQASPKFEVSESDNEVSVKAELPGLDEKDIEVELQENMLTIRGEKKNEREEKNRNYHLSEVSYGQFSRSVPLPSGIDRDNVKATFKKGVLTLNIPKTEQAAEQRKRIEISAE